MNRYCLRFMLLAMVSLHHGPAAMAVDRAPSLVGIIRDLRGQPIPGVSVTATEAYSRTETYTFSARDGRYRFDELPEGIYRLDFRSPGSAPYRWTNVQVKRGAAVEADVTLQIESICECIYIGGLKEPQLRKRRGQVADQSGRPLAYARLELTTPWGRDKTVADSYGGFIIEAPVNGTWPLTVSDSGFAPVTQDVSGETATPLVVTLPRALSPGPPAGEAFPDGCRCPGPFLHPRW